MYKLGTIIIIVIYCFGIVKAENPCGIMSPSLVENWGQGFLYIPMDVCVDVYDTDGQAIYNLERKNKGSILFWLANNAIKEVVYNDLSFVASYEMPLVRVFNGFEDERFLRILPKSSKDTVLIRLEDLSFNGGELYSSLDLLDSSKLNEELKEYASWASIGVNNPKSCLNLRSGPNLESEVESCIKSNDWGTEDYENAHFKILDWSGNWAKVEVNIHALKPNAETECDFELKNTLTGWVKAVDDIGKPNIWYSVTAY